MSDEGLKIILGADGSQVTKTLAELQRQLKAFYDGLKTSTNPESIARLNRALEATKTQINALKGFKGFASDIRSVAPASNTAGQALQNLGRIAQDAPFGFIGISNNINPLLESFQRLRATSGSTGGALKALAGSMMGAGGIGLAVSVVTGLLVVFGDRLFRTNHLSAEAAESAKKYAEAQKSSAENIQKQVLEVESLVRIAQSDVSTKKEQHLALQRLNEVIPDNIGKLNLLNIKTEEGITIIRKYTKALEDQAVAELLRGRAAEIRVKLFDAEKKRTDENLRLGLKALQAQKKLDVTNVPAQQRASEAFAASQARVAQSIIDSREQIIRNDKEFLIAEQTFNNELAGLRLEIDRNTKGGIATIAGDPKKEAKVKDFLSERIKQLEEYQKLVGLSRGEEFQLRGLKIDLLNRDGLKEGLSHFQVQRMIDELMAAQPAVNMNLKFRLDPSVLKIDALGNEVIKINTALAALGRPIENEGAAVITQTFSAAEKSAMRLKEVLVTNLAPAFQGVFDTIIQGSGNALQAFGNALKALVAKMVSAAITAAILAAVLSALPGGQAFGAGFKAIFGMLSGVKLASGGVTTKPTFALIGEQGPEAVIPLRDLNRVLGSIGGAGGREVFIVENRLEGDIIVQAYRRASNRYGGTFT